MGDISHNNSLFNLNIERAVLSAILFDNEIYHTVSTKISHHTFFLPFHKAMFLAMEELFKDEKPIDEDFLKIYLTKKNSYDEIKLLDVMAVNPISNVEPYLKELKSRENKRKLKSLSFEINKSVQDENVSVDDAMVSIQEQMESIRGEEWSLEPIKSSNLDDAMPEFYLKDFMPIPQKAITLLSADGGVGKSTSMAQIAVRFVLDTNFKKKVCLWLSEDPQPITKRNIRSAISMLGYRYKEQEIMEMIDVISKEPPALVVPNGFKSSKVSNKFNIMKRTLRGYGLLVFDPFTDFFGGAENDADDVSAFFKPFKYWVADEGNSIIFLHHANANGKSRGSTGIKTAVRMAYEMDFHRSGEKIDGSRLHERQVKLTKDNWGGGSSINAFVGTTFNVQLFPKGKVIDKMKKSHDAQAEETVYEMPKDFV